MEAELKAYHLLGAEIITIVLDFTFFRCSECSSLTEDLYGHYSFGDVKKTMCWFCDGLNGEKDQLMFQEWNKQQF